MTERLDGAPPRTWNDIIASVPGAEAVGARAEDADPAGTTGAASARGLASKLVRDDETPAELLAMIEREVSQPATRARLDEMREWQSRQRAEVERLDGLTVPDHRPWRTRAIESLLVGLPGLALGATLLPFLPGDSFDIPVAIAALAALGVVARSIVTAAGRVDGAQSWRGYLLAVAAVLALAPVVTLARIGIAGDSASHGLVTDVGLAVQAAAVLAVAVAASRVPTAAKQRERHASDPRAPRDARDLSYADIEDEIAAITDAVETEAPSRVRSALSGRDPAVAARSRPAVVEAIRVLFERGQIDGDDAEWMIWEAVGA